MRTDAARALADGTAQHLKSADLTRFHSALDEYIASQRFNAERPEAQVNLANFFLARGHVGEAEVALLKAIEVDPSFVPAPIALAELRRAQGQESAAETTLRSALERHPKSGALLHALGLSLVRQKRTDEAITVLRDAAERAPEAARFSYVAGVALHDTGKRTEAIQILAAALGRHPYDRQILYALTSYEMQAGQLESALSRATLLKQLEPDDASIGRLLTTLHEAMGK